MAKTAWGIEAGTSTVKAVKLSYDGKSVYIEDMASIPLAHYRVEGGDDHSALVGALSKFVQDKGIGPKETVFISLAGRNAFSRVITLPPVGPDAIRQTIINEARGQIPIKLEEAVWDYQPIKSDSDEVQVNLYAVKRDVVNALVNTCKTAGLPIAGIQLAPLGIYNFVKHELDASISQACVCIDIGADNTDLLIIDGEKTWIRVVPFAGNDVTKAILMKFKKLSPEQGEQLKRRAGQSKDAAAIFEAMKPPLKEMVGEIYRSVGFYKNQNEDVQLNKLVMMGNGSRLFNLPKFFEQQLQYEVHRVEELTSIQPARGMDPGEVQDNVQSLTVALGLGLQALELPGMSDTNLIPSDLAREAGLKKVRIFAVIAGAIVLLCGILCFLLAMSRDSYSTSLVSDLKTESAFANQQLSKLSQVKAVDAVQTVRIESLNNIDHGADLPYLASLFFSYTVEEFQAAAARESGSKFQLLWCMRPDQAGGGNEGKDAFSVRTIKAAMEERPQQGEGQQQEDPSLRPYERSVQVELTANFAVNLTLWGRSLSDADRNVSDELRKRLSKKLHVLLKNQPVLHYKQLQSENLDPQEIAARTAKMREDQRVAFEKQLAEEFGGAGNTVMIKAMLRLRDILGQLPEKQDEAEAAVKEMIEVGGLQQLNAATIDQVFPPQGSSGIPLTAGADQRENPKDEFYHTRFTLRFTAKPWRYVAPVNPDEGQN